MLYTAENLCPSATVVHIHDINLRWRMNSLCYQQRWSWTKFVYNTYGLLQRYMYVTRNTDRCTLCA